MITIRGYKEEDWSEVWAIIEPVFRSGTTYAFSPEITEKETKEVWVEAQKSTRVCCDEDNNIIGTYIKPNQPTLGPRICNCGYIVDGIVF